MKLSTLYHFEHFTLPGMHFSPCGVWLCKLPWLLHLALFDMLVLQDG